MRAQGKTDLADQFSGMTLGGKIAMLQNDPALAQQFLHTQGVSLGEGTAVGPLRDLLLNRNSGMSRGFADNMRSMPAGAGLGRMADEAIGNFRLNPMEPLARATRTIGSLHEQTMSQFPDTLGPDQRQQIIDILMAGGNSNLGSRLNGFVDQFRDGKAGTSISDARDQFASERNRLKTGWTAPTYGPGGGGTFYDPNAKQSVDRLDKVISALDKLLEENKRNTTAVKELGGLPVTNN